jgi:hypothetical protein
MVETEANPDLHRCGPTRSVVLGLAGTVAPNPVMGAHTALAWRPQVPELLDMSFEDLPDSCFPLRPSRLCGSKCRI